MPDSHKNFAYSTVATAPIPADTGTSLVVQAGEGALFPAVPFNATVWPAGVQPLASNAEVVRVTNITTDTFTITRQQEGSSARSIVIGDQIAATVTNKTLVDAEAKIIDADRDTKVDVEESADEDKVRIDVAGIERLKFQATSPHLTITGNTRLEGNVGLFTIPSANFAFALGKVSTTIMFGLQFTMTFSDTQGSMRGVNAAVTHTGSSATADVYGGFYLATKSNAVNSSGNLIGLHVETRAGQDNTGVWNETRVIEVGTPNYTNGYYTTTTHIGILIQNQYSAGQVTGPTTFYGLKIDHISGGATRRLIEALTSANVNLRLEGNDPSSAGAGLGRSQLLLGFNENGALNLRRVEWLDSGAAGGGGIPANARLLHAV